jgi:hypothetical protein
MLAGQPHNSSASNPGDFEQVWKSLLAIHANTAELPIYWELIEPERGKFDFHLIDEMILGARRNGLRLVILWFGSWKNGEMHYTPGWIKRNSAWYKRVAGGRGEELDILSPLCEAARDADANAFAAVMHHIKSLDDAEHTVIMMQVENETGLLGTDRDYSDEATRLFRGAVPSELISYLSKNRSNVNASLKVAWEKVSSPASSSWTAVFGDLAPEVFSAWQVARYVDAVAAAGKLVYPLPMYANAWVIEGGMTHAGEWPSGGPCQHVLDIWKAAAPHLDILAPDIDVLAPETYDPKFYSLCEQYARPDNPLLIPEIQAMPHLAANIFLALGHFNGLGFSPFGVDDFLENGTGTLTPTADEFEDSFRVLRPLLPLISRSQYTGKLYPIIQGNAQGEDWSFALQLGNELAASVEFTSPYFRENGRGMGLIIKLAPDDFILAGARFRVNFRELRGLFHEAEILSIEEGTFEGERWLSRRRLNGDEMHAELPQKSKILRVRLIR